MKYRQIGAMLCALSITTSFIPYEVCAEDLVITAKKYVPGYTLTLSGADESATYSWESKAENGGWVVIDGATSSSYTIKNAQANQQIRAAVTTEDGIDYSNVVEIGANLGVADYKTNFPYDTNPSEYLVTLADDTSTTFSLLDAVDGENGKEYFALLGYQVATASFAGDKPTARFDPTDPENIGYWMNDSENGMLAEKQMKRRYGYSSSTYTYSADNDGDGKPDAAESGTFSGLRSLGTIIDKYVVEHDWLTEAGHEDTGVTDDYVFTARYTVLSTFEAIQYKDKFGYRLSSTYQRLRSPYKYSPTTTYPANSGKDINYLTSFTTTTKATAKDTTSYIVSGTWCGNLGVRPCFYLNEDFFKEVKLDLTATGSEVKKIIVENYDEDELGIYTDEELKQMGYEDVSAENVQINCVAEIGETITLTYDYKNSNADAVPNQNYKWYVSDSENGVYTEIAGENNATYVIREADLGKYIKAGVAPKDSFGRAKTESLSNVTMKIRAEQYEHVVLETAPIVDNVTEMSATVTISTVEAGTTDMLIVMALYDNNNKLLKMDYDIVSVSNTPDDYDLYIDGIVPGTEYKAKVMVFESVANPRPCYSADF